VGALVDPMFDRLDAAFEHATASVRRSPHPISLLFSGGVDSGLLAWELRDRPQLRLITVGAPGSPDLRAAELAAEQLGVPWTGTEVTDSDIAQAAAEVERERAELSPTLRGVLVSLAVALRHSPTEAVLCGQGADELFLGYAHFLPLEEAAAAQRSDSDFSRLLEHDWPRTVRLAARMDHALTAPYLDPEFIDAARAVPIRERLPHPVPKSFLRTWAKHRGLPNAIADRPKKALQFGSGIARRLRELP
jgi:asparagine synthase (glutamine-hydrolysing)